MNIIERLPEEFKEKCIRKFLEDAREILMNGLEMADMVNIPALAGKAAKIFAQLMAAFIALIVKEVQSCLYLDREFCEQEGIRRHEPLKERTYVFDEIGAVTLSSDQYRDEQGKQFSFINKHMGMPKRERVQKKLKLKMAMAAATYSYRTAAEIVSDGEVSYSTAYRALQAIEIPEFPLPEKKRECRILLVFPDEIHAALQSGSKRCKQVAVGALAEGVEKICAHRSRLCGRFYFASRDGSGPALVRDIADYINIVYDVEKIDAIYVFGDGAKWIQTALDEDFPGQVIHVMDSYHRFKQVYAMARAFPHKHVCEKISEAFLADDLQSFLLFAAQLEKSAAQDKKLLKKIREFKKYVVNNWDAMVHSVVPGLPMRSCTEAIVQHFGADRCTTRPMGWAEPSLCQLMQLRAFVLNGGDLTRLEEYAAPGTWRRESQRLQDEWEKNLLGRKHDFSVCDWTAPAIHPSGSTGIFLNRISENISVCI